MRLTMAKYNKLDIERIRKKFENKTTQKNNCLLWTGSASIVHGKEHPYLYYKDDILNARHIAWLLHYGEYPKYTIMLVCWNYRCVDYKHLKLRTLNVRNLSFKQRFWLYTDKSGEDECWLWNGALTDGYGHIKYNGKSIGAHVASWFIHYGKWPNLLVCHSCDNRRCVNPKHLFLGTKKANAQDSLKKGRLARAKLTPNQVIEIYQSQLPVSELAIKYGVSKYTLWDIKAKRTWATITNDLPEPQTKMTQYIDTIPDYGELMTIAEFSQSCESGFFIDYDGFGHPVKDGKMANITIVPSRLDLLPPDATHIVWFNR